MPIKIGSIQGQGGKLIFADRSFKPGYQTTIESVETRITGLSTEATEPAKVDIKGRVDGHAPVTISGAINPLADEMYADLAFDFQQMDLTAMVLMWISGLTMVTGVLGAAAQMEFRRVLSFHIVSQIGYMVMGLGLLTPLGLAGSVFYLMHHIVVKTNLFLVGGIVRHLGGSYALQGDIPLRTWAPLTLDVVESTDPLVGGDDVIHAGDGKDVVFGGTLDFAVQFGWLDAPSPKIAAYVERIRQRPAYQQSHTPPPV